jgi:hypothetical protein
LIQAPKRGSGFTVRQVDADEIEPQRTAERWAAADEAFKDIDKVFKSFFKPMFKR